MTNTNKTFRATNTKTQETVEYAFASNGRCDVSYAGQLRENVKRDDAEVEIAGLVIANWEVKRVA